MSQSTWTVVGGGNMASSIVGGAISAGRSADDFSLIEVDASRRDRLQDEFGVETFASLDDAPPNRALLLAVKPDIVRDVCAEIRTLDQAPGLVTSVAAGVRADTLSGWLPEGTAVVRCMPNTPALLGLGATGLFATPACSEEQRDAARALLESVGTVVEIEHEDQLDAVTALSGSGPAYLFYLVELMAKSGEALGLPHDVAVRLAIETAYGAASMARRGEDSPGELRRKVTSPGGTTAAAVSAFDDGGLPALVDTAMRAAHDRGREIGREMDDA